MKKLLFVLVILLAVSCTKDESKLALGEWEYRTENTVVSVDIKSNYKAVVTITTVPMKPFIENFIYTDGEIIIFTPTNIKGTRYRATVSNDIMVLEAFMNGNTYILKKL